MARGYFLVQNETKSSRLINEGKNLVICEVDVPDNELEKLVENKSIKFGHGLCLAWELLKDLKKRIIRIYFLIKFDLFSNKVFIFYSFLSLAHQKLTLKLIDNERI